MPVIIVAGKDQRGASGQAALKFGDDARVGTGRQNAAVTSAAERAGNLALTVARCCAYAMPVWQRRNACA
ncbi:MAG: hypothetical protein RMM51_12210 [Verrucomicrobiae bacterium]|nr:hypothetical protein [Verrucomicrobiae bacterium]